VLISANSNNLCKIKAIVDEYDIEFSIIGEVVTDQFSINNLINLKLAEIATLYNNTIEKNIIE